MRGVGAQKRAVRKASQRVEVFKPRDSRLRLLLAREVLADRCQQVVHRARP